MQGEPAPDSAAAISMLRRLNAAGPAGEMPFKEALACASTLSHGHGQELLSSLSAGNLIAPVGNGAIGLVRLTAAGREALASGRIPVHPPGTGPSGAGRSARDGSANSELADTAAERSSSMMREHAGFVAVIAGVIIALAAGLAAIGVPDAQSAAAQSQRPLDLWGDDWFMASAVIGVIGVILLFAAIGLYCVKRRRR